MQPVQVAAYIELLQAKRSAPTIRQRLACIRMLFGWLVVGQILLANSAHPVRGPRHSVTKGVTPVLSSEEATALLTGMDVSTVVGLRDRAIIAVITYTFARVVALAVEDYFSQKKRWWSPTGVSVALKIDVETPKWCEQFDHVHCRSWFSGNLRPASIES